MWRSWDVAGKAGAYLAAKKWWILFFVLLAVRACIASAIFIICKSHFCSLHAAELAFGGTLHTVPALWWLMLLMEMKKNQDATETKATADAFSRRQLMSSYCHINVMELYNLYRMQAMPFSLKIKNKHET
jgi:hypothetical protein